MGEYIGIIILSSAISVGAGVLGYFLSKKKYNIKYRTQEVREIVRTPFEAITFKDEFEVDEFDYVMRKVPPEIMKQKIINESLDRLYHSIPLEMVEFIELATISPTKRYITRITILPPKRKP